MLQVDHEAHSRLEAEQASTEHCGVSTDTSSPTLVEGRPMQEIALERDAEFWYEDGSIYLIASGVEFRVYRGPLVEHSPVFRDMLSLPQPALPAGSIAQYPVVPMLESPIDLRNFLRALMPSKQLQLFQPPVPSLSVLSTWIRLGHKYQVDDLVQQALGHLRTMYPSTYSAYCSRTGCFPGVWSIHVVNLARLIGAHDLIPVALMECCKAGGKIVYGCQSPISPGVREGLSAPDLQLLFQAQKQLIKARVETSLKLFDTEAPDMCSNKEVEEPYETDSTDIVAIRDKIARGDIPGLCSAQIFGSWMSIVKGHHPPFCHACVTMLESRQDELYREMWARLPELVGVAVPEGWDDEP